LKRTRICELLGIRYPIIQAPMIWITGAELAAAVSNAGGLGTIGFNAGVKTLTNDVNITGERLRTQIRKAKELTDKPFAVNFHVPEQPFSDRCVEVALEEGIAVALLVGDSPESYTRRFREAGVKVLYRPQTRVTVEAARRGEEAGVDAVIVVGFESGGHSGRDELSTLVLVPQVVDAVRIPVIAGGGIADGRGVAAVLALGAEGIYLGTAFIATNECDIHPELKKVVVGATDTSTTTWYGPQGLSRALKNTFTDEVLKMRAEGASLKEIGRFCYGADRFRPGLVEGDVDRSFIPLGAIAGLIKRVEGAGEMVERLAEESNEVLSRLV
jgi:NAD(P)H-dependent flavin oxidoreductase YrpB (nitropropane dioxygenase family)